MFHALSDAFKLIGQSRGHGVLRAMAVTHLRKYKEAYEPAWDMCTPDSTERPMDAADFEKYLDLPAAEGSWGGGLELTALANTLNVCLRVYTGDGTFVFNDAGNKTLVLRFHQKHFEALKGQISSPTDWGVLKPGPRVGLRAGGKSAARLLLFDVAHLTKYASSYERHWDGCSPEKRDMAMPQRDFLEYLQRLAQPLKSLRAQ